MLAGHVVAATGAGSSEPDALARFGLVTRIGTAGINGLFVFFALSGLLIAGPFMAAWWARRPAPSLRRYARHRLLRIVPPFLVTVLAVLLVWGAEGASVAEMLPVPLFAQSLFMQTPLSGRLAHAWSLGAELFFYGLVGVIGAVAVARATRRDPVRDRRRARQVTVGLAVAFAALYVVFDRSLASDDPIAIHRPWAQLVAFVPGLLLALWASVQPVFDDPTRTRRWAAVGIAVCLAVLAAFSWYVGPLGLTTSYLAAIAAAGGLVAGAVIAERAGARQRWLDNPPLQWLGARSYGIYLVHFPLLSYLVERVDQTRWWRALLIIGPATLLGSVLGGDLLHRLVERPSRRLRVPRRERAPVTP